MPNFVAGCRFVLVAKLAYTPAAPIENSPTERRMQSFDYVVLGSGVAGLTAALTLAEHQARVLVVNKGPSQETNTFYAQGGVAVVLHEDDNYELHIQDTMEAGAHLNDLDAVRYLVERGPVLIRQLIGWGANFDREGDELKFTREAAHSTNRILHAQGDATGNEIQRTLQQRVQDSEYISVWEDAQTTELLRDDLGKVCGVRLCQCRQHAYDIYTQGVILATGGLGRLYQYTTNPDIATGDGVILALRAGAALVDMEFIQFHPTALNLEGAPPFLLSESMRGEGAVLRNHAGEQFMPRYSPMAELAPRDVVSRSIAFEMEKTGKPVYLDISHKDADFIRERFPTIYSTCMRYGLDMSAEPIPVSPAAHYCMGGVETGLDARTSVSGLYAAGEVACTSVHGANRLASNSLLEGLVFGERAALSALEDRQQDNPCRTEFVEHLCSGDLPRVGARMQQIMWKAAGIKRSESSLLEGLREIECESPYYVPLCQAIMICALRRKRSIGAHYRTDSDERLRDRRQALTWAEIAAEVRAIKKSG